MKTEEIERRMGLLGLQFLMEGLKEKDNEKFLACVQKLVLEQ